MHRKVLEQCLEVRESVMELLTHREALTQCIELRDGVQAVLSSSRLLSEIGDRTAELDLSLAGVSDNTARHGKAISTLTEQQKRTTATLDAVVRAVKRLDRGRSRSRNTSTTPVIRGGSTPGCMVDGLNMEPPSKAQVAVDVIGREATLNGDCGCNGGCGDPLSWGEDPIERCTDSRGFENFDNDDWNWPGVPGEYDEPALLPNEDELQFCSASSSCGSDGRPWPRRPFLRPWGGCSPLRHGRPFSSRYPNRGYYGGMGCGIPDLSSGAPPAAEPPVATADVAHCVKGVLARIEEALTKLDGPPRQELGVHSGRSHSAQAYPGMTPRPLNSNNGWDMVDSWA